MSHEAGQKIDRFQGSKAIPVFDQPRQANSPYTIVSEDLITRTAEGVVRIESVVYAVAIGRQSLPIENRHRREYKGVVQYTESAEVETEKQGCEPKQAVVWVKDELRIKIATPRWNQSRRDVGLSQICQREIAYQQLLAEKNFLQYRSVIEAIIRGSGGKVTAHSAMLGIIQVECLSCDLPTLQELDFVSMVVPEEAGIIEAVDAPAPKSTLESYTCTGSPARAIDGIDIAYGCASPQCTPSSSCNDSGTTSPCSFIDAIANVMGIYQYRNRGFLGKSTGGNSCEEALVAGVIDSGFNLLHPAWNDGSGTSRVLGVYTRLSIGHSPILPLPILPSSGSWYSPDEPYFLPPEYGTHGQRVASIIGSDTTLGQDSNLSILSVGFENRENARTGFAPRIFFRLASTSRQNIWSYGAADLEDVLTGYVEQPVDMINYSIGVTANNCATNNGARGISTRALAFTGFYRDYGVLTFKSAGNNFTLCNTVGVRMSGPAATGGMIAVGAQQANVPAIGFQSETSLNNSTGGDVLPDGRTWPHLVTPGNVCGQMAAVNFGQDQGNCLDMWYDGQYLYGHPVYSNIGATSSCAPKLAGAAALFKEWYISLFGDHANQPGRIMVNLLNMGDRFGGGGSSLQPVARWGLGRFRLKDWDASSRSHENAGFFLTARVSLGEGERYTWDIVHSVSGVVASDVQRLNAVVWWDEPNTASGETKPTVYLYLTRVYNDGGVFTVTEVVDYAHNDNSQGGEQLVSLTFDNCDDRKPCIEGGYYYYIDLYVASMTTAARGPYGDYREFYVSCAWESDPDESLVDCGGADPCTTTSVSCDNRPSNAR